MVRVCAGVAWRATMRMDLFDGLTQGLGDSEVEDVCVGLYWTAVKAGFLGLAKTVLSPQPGVKLKDCGDLTEKSALDLGDYARSWNFTEASVGLAAINSLVEAEGEPVNAFDFACEKFRGKRITLVGHFPDKEINKFREANEVSVLERKPQSGDYPDTAAEYIIPKSDVTMITASAIINKSLPRLLKLSEKAYTIVFGPSTPVSDSLLGYGVDALGGVKAVNEDRVLRKVREGAHLFDFKKDLKFVIKARDD